MDILALLVSFVASLILPFTTAPAPEPAPEPASVAACANEDGSGDQTFPCYWNGGENGLGEHYTLTEPVQSEPVREPERKADEPVPGRYEPEPEYYEPEPEYDPNYLPEPGPDGTYTFDDGDGYLVVPYTGEEVI